MILLLAVIAGLLAGLARAWYGERHLSAPHLRVIWLVPLAFLPQWLAFFLPVTRRSAPDDWAAATLVSSQVLLLIFAWFNRKQPGFWALGLGLACNLLVITLNGGLMPISPHTVARLASGATCEGWQVGQRLGTGKDIVLPEAATRLWWLSDRFLLPDWFPYRVAFSLGDVLIAGGAFWLLWSLGGQRQPRTKEEKVDMHARVSLSPGVSPNGTELSRLMNAAVVSKEFCNLLLTNPALALATGYNGESFRLATEDRELVLSIQATSLSEFALQLSNSRNGKDNHQ